MYKIRCSFFEIFVQGKYSRTSNTFCELVVWHKKRFFVRWNEWERNKGDQKSVAIVKVLPANASFYTSWVSRYLETDSSYISRSSLQHTSSKQRKVGSFVLPRVRGESRQSSALVPDHKNLQKTNIGFWTFFPLNDKYQAFWVSL